jgi:hypothetical protein
VDDWICDVVGGEQVKPKYVLDLVMSGKSGT